MPIAYISPMGQHGLYHIHFVGGHADNDLPGRPARPDQGLPGYGHPDQGLPGYGHPDNSLPGRPPRPDHGLPGHGHPDHGLPAIPGVPDNSLPTTPPPTVQPGQILVMVRSADGKWKWASIDGSTAPTPLPEVPQPTPV